MNSDESLVRTRDDRTLAVATLGDPSGYTVFLHHGTPGSAAFVDMFEEFVAGSGLFLVAMSRPGYGESTRREGREIVSVVEDVRCVLDALGRDEYVSVGWSGGGPHALACGSVDVGRCRKVWSLAGVVPIDVDFDWTAGMGPENREEFALSLEGGPIYEAHVASAGEAFSHADPDNILELFGGLLSNADRDVLNNLDTRRNFANNCRRGFSHGYYGFRDDDRAFVTPWGFDVATVHVPVSVWYGDQDLMVPPTHGAWLAQHLDNVDVRHFDREGHISLVVSHVDELFSSFREAFEDVASA